MFPMLWAGAGLALIAPAGGCDNNVGLGGASLNDPLASVDLSDMQILEEVEADDNFDAAQPLEVFLLNQPMVLAGTLSTSSDVDVYDIGPAQAGDRIQAALREGGDMPIALALFDAGGSAILINDHRNVYLGKSEPFLDRVLPAGEQRLFVAVSSTPGYDAVGPYQLVLIRTRAPALPEPNEQKVFLNFDGARDIILGGREPIDVPAFDAARISPRFEGWTAQIEAQVAALVREHFEGYHVLILSTSEGATAGRDLTRIHFGTHDPALLGLAEGVDEFNSDLSQDAIVFTDTFAAFEILEPTIDQISAALANVASHEIGHLLGLVHTQDPNGIMDITAGLSRLLEGQWFGISPIHPSVLPIGLQDEPNYLIDSVGGDAGLVEALASTHARPILTASEALLFRGAPERGTLSFGTCGTLSHWTQRNRH